MSSLEKKSFNAPDEVRSLDKTTVEILHMPAGSIGRFTFQPGWKWSEHVGPAMGTESCQASHFGAVISGRIHVVHEDGAEGEAGPGDVYTILPGHDAWVVGDEPFVGLELQDPPDYIKA